MTVSPGVYKRIVELTQEVLGALSGLSRYDRRYYVAFISGFPPDGSTNQSLPAGQLINDLLDPARNGLPFHAGSPHHKLAGFVGLASGDGDFESARLRAAWVHDLLATTLGTSQVINNIDVVRLNEPRPGFTAVGSEHPQNRGVAVVLAVDHLRPPVKFVPPTTTNQWEMDFTGSIDIGSPFIKVLSGTYSVGTLRNLATMERRMIRLIGGALGASLNLNLPVTLSLNLFPAPHQFVTRSDVDFDAFQYTPWTLFSNAVTAVYEVQSFEDFSFPDLGARFKRDNLTFATDVSIDLGIKTVTGLTFVGGVV